MSQQTSLESDSSVRQSIWSAAVENCLKQLAADTDFPVRVPHDPSAAASHWTQESADTGISLALRYAEYRRLNPEVTVNLDDEQAVYDLLQAIRLIV